MKMADLMAEPIAMGMADKYPKPIPMQREGDASPKIKEMKDWYQ